MLRNTSFRSTACSYANRITARSLFLPTADRDKQAESKPESQTNDHPSGTEESGKAKKPQKTLAQMDEELRAAMEGHSGDGGISGAELEDGKAVAMKRGVRNNMFRYI